MEVARKSTIQYDALNRPVATLLYNNSTTALKVETITYGTSAAGYTIGKPVTVRDQGGKLDITSYDFKGNLLSSTRRLCNDYNLMIDWFTYTDPTGESFNTEFSFDAMNRPVTETTPDDKVRTYEYNKAGLLERVLLDEGLGMATDTDFINSIPVPNAGSGAMQNYTQLYSYDQLGNMLTVQSQNKWTRSYYYDNATNRLLRHDTGSYVYSYDAQGNMLSMPHLQLMGWDYKGNLIKTVGGTITTYYRYDSNGNRVRKIAHKTGAITEERIYIGNYELYRKKVSGILNTERETTFVSDDTKRIAIVDTCNLPTPVEVTIRYQYDNHLGSACLELDNNAQVISYEEYHPFGTTSYRAGRNATETALKRYKYVGKERDEETGLYYYGARYYAAWLCRFVSVDPLQFKYPHYTPFQYAGNKPISFIDLDGLEEAKNKKIDHEKFSKELERLDMLNKTIDFYYEQLKSFIPSQNEISQYDQSKRPVSEINLIKTAIREQLYETNKGFILISPADQNKALVASNIKSLSFQGISEVTPILLKAGSAATYETANTVENYIINKAFHSKFTKELANPNLTKYVTATKIAGTILKNSARFIGSVSTLLIYWDILNANSPKRIDKDTIRESTKRVISNYINSKYKK